MSDPATERLQYDPTERHAMLPRPLFDHPSTECPGGGCLHVAQELFALRDAAQAEINRIEAEPLTGMNDAQRAALKRLSENYHVPFIETDFLRHQGGLPPEYVSGWIGGNLRKLYVGCDADGRISS